MKIEYTEFSLDIIVKFFLKDVTYKDGTPLDYTYFIDPVKRAVILKMYIKENNEKVNS